MTARSGPPVLAALAAVLAGALGWLIWRSTIAPPDRAPPRAMAPDGLPDTAGGARDGAEAAVAPVRQPGGPGRSRAIPEVLPDFALASLEGPSRRLSSFDHPSLVINFWATWCAPCRREIPLLKQIRRERAANGVEVIGIAVDFRKDVVKYARQIDIDYPLLIGEQDGLAAAEAFGLDLGFPFTIFADGQRRIVAVKIGELHANEAAFVLDRVAEINAGTLAVEAARPLVAQALREFAEQRGDSARAAANGS
jgi:thiol-disulfide isomerase/thioredoxin